MRWNHSSLDSSKEHPEKGRPFLDTPQLRGCSNTSDLSHPTGAPRRHLILQRIGHDLRRIRLDGRALLWNRVVGSGCW